MFKSWLYTLPVEQTLKMKPSNSKVQRIPLWRFPMTASWTHRTPWQSSLTSTPRVVEDLSWITKQMVGESIFGSLNPLSYLCDLCIVMGFSISQLRRGCYRYAVAIWILCTILGHRRFIFLLLKFFTLRKFLRFRVLKVKTMSEYYL